MRDASTLKTLRRAAPALGIALVAATAAFAAPAGNPRIEATDFLARGHEATTETVECDNGERVTGGGVIQSSGSSGTAADLRLDASGPVGASRWRSAVTWDALSSEYKPMRAFAICADAKTVIRSTTKHVELGGTAQAHVKCASGERAIGGGFIVGPTANGIFAEANGPLDASGAAATTQDGDVAREWYTHVINLQGQTEKTVKISVVCSRNSNSVIESTLFAVGGGAGDYYGADCGNKRALGGGVVPEGSPLGMYVRTSGPLDNTGQTLETSDGDLARSWYGSVLNINGGPVRYWHTYAICE